MHTVALGLASDCCTHTNTVSAWTTNNILCSLSPPPRKSTKATISSDQKTMSPLYIFLLLSLLQVAASRATYFRSRSLLQEVSENSLPKEISALSESDGDAHLGEKGTGIVDNPDPGYEKVEVEETSCDDGLGPDPNILERNDKHTNSGDNTSPEFNPETKLERIVRKTVQKYSDYNMDNGKFWLKRKKDRIPLCPGAKKRAPIPGIDCTLVEPERIVPSCCGCGCGCCKQKLRALVNNVVNKNLHIDMETGRPFKNLPLCRELKSAMVQDIRKEKNVPLKALLLRKIKEDSEKLKK